ADCDTKALAHNYYQVKSLAPKDIQNLINTIKNQLSLCIYGSGFEAYPESLSLLESQFQLIGNSSKVFNALQNKPLFFRRLQHLNISFPNVIFTLENNIHKNKITNYLIKPFDSLGGLNIQAININNSNNLCHPRHYYQKHIEGQSMSVLFVADGKQAIIIGFNQQWTVENSFLFSGVINHVELPVFHQKKLYSWISKLTLSYKLQGLCSLDFIFYKNKCYVLEINPRPPASKQLYEKYLLKNHYLACLGQLGKVTIPQYKTYTAYQIIYATTKIKIPSQMKWPKYCCSLPQKNTIINKGQPICSMILNGINPQSLLEDLQNKQYLFFTQISETT
ncbi:MAG: ATP-grasp domain-containing protein, partial [Methylococcales bacterium]|nr:ATP-grasp domain-containing protein [Methylococcales bacterium]